MSTPAPTPLQPSPGMTAFLNHFNTIAAVAAATIAQEQADNAAGAPFAQKLNDAVTGSAYALATVFPPWAPEVAAGLAAFQTGAAIVTSLVNLFHHHKAAPAPAPAPSPAPSAPPSAPSGPAVAGANQ